MTPRVKLNFDNVYPLIKSSGNPREGSFEAELKDQSPVIIHFKIDHQMHPRLNNVYNLAYGPVTIRGYINDKIELQFADYSKVFSTILYNASLYLNRNPGLYLGINGSDFRRAYLYYRLIKNNYDFLVRFFIIKGIKYYVRISRLGKMDYDNPFDFEDIALYPQVIEKNERLLPDKLYNYFIFKKRI